MDPTANTDAPDTENETPPPTANNKLTNGALKRHSPHHHHHHHRRPPQPPAVLSIYKECLKNHAASMGGHAVDGCGEFLPSPTADPTVPTSLKCDACGCHRNFHRRVVGDPTTHFLDFHRHLQQLPPPSRRSSPLSSPSPPPPQPAYYSSVPHMLLALRTAEPEDQPTVNRHSVATPAKNPSGRKRFRTKFSQEQKEKMFLISEKLGWKIQKCDQGLVEEFCNEVGVGKGVLKVWMHNNKHTLGKKDLNSATATVTATATTAVVKNNSKSNGRLLNFNGNDGRNTTTTNNGHLQNECNKCVHLHISRNGSPSSA